MKLDKLEKQLAAAEARLETLNKERERLTRELSALEERIEELGRAQEDIEASVAVGRAPETDALVAREAADAAARRVREVREELQAVEVESARVARGIEQLKEDVHAARCADWTQRHKAAVAKLQEAFDRFLDANDVVGELEDEGAGIGAVGVLTVRHAWPQFRRSVWLPHGEYSTVGAWLLRAREYVGRR